MVDIIHLRRRLIVPPTTGSAAGIRLQTFTAPRDVPLWLELRERAFRDVRPAVRAWDASDFEREFLAKSWWRPEHMWFGASDRSLVGTVTLAFRSSGEVARPVVHWLAVLPEWRRRGVGRLLMSVLEARVWELGYREVWLETHAGWKEAVRLYRALGYEAANVSDTSRNAS